jgi:gliding motility-associated-like protein
MFKPIRLVFILLVLFSVKAFPTHIVGGEIYYECLGNNKYRITLKVFRDCYNGIPWFDSPAYVGVWDVNNNLVNTLELTPPGSDTLPVTINNPCIIPPANVCVEQCIYTDTVTLPPIAGGYTLVYQRCCRNHTILNIANPGSVGSTYFTNIPDNSTVSCNNSPHFKNYPPIFICADLPLKFDHSAIDSDGDSLVYELCDTYNGGSTFDPIPNPPWGPPYQVVPWTGGFNGANPMSSNPTIIIDPQTGMITGTPDMIGQWVVGVCVREYRKGILLGIHKRDFQFNVTYCGQVVVTSIPTQQTFCFGNTVNFLNNSVNATNYHWDFGVPPLTNDTSNLITPTYTYPDTGVYIVTLIGNPGSICADTAVTTFKIYPQLLPNFFRPVPQCVLNNSYNFSGTGVTTSKSTYLWNFGLDATPATSTLKDPTGIIFATPGKHLVKFTIKDHGCSQFFTDTVTVLPPPTPAISPQTGQCINANSFDFKGTGNITSAATYSWSFGQNANPVSSTQQNVNGVTFHVVGKIPVTFSITDQGCTVSTTDTIIIYPLPIAKFKPIPTIGCKPLSVQFTDSSLAGTALNYLWNFGDGTTSTQTNPQHTYTQSGKYSVSLTIVATNGCIDTLTFAIPDMITVRPGPSSALDVDKTTTTISDPDFTFTEASLSSIGCKIMFGDGDSSLNCTTKHTYNKTGKYTVRQIVIDEYGCLDTTFVIVEVTPDIRFFIPNAFSPNGSGLNDTFMPVMEGIASYHFMIFDRWGELFFETTDQTKGWDGTFNKKICPQDVYVYIVKLTDIKSNYKTYIGHVTLVR